MTLVRVDGLGVEYATPHGYSPVLFDVNFVLERGEALAIVGESGSGKSTLAMTIAGLLPASARVHGSVHIGGRDLTSLPAKALEDIRGQEMAVIFQNPMTSLNPTMRIGRQIQEQLHRHRSLSRSACAARALELLDEVRIRDPRRVAARYPHELSGGMRQRAMIAMAISCGPTLLLADEPTTALDVTVQAQILDILKALQREHNMALILVTHDMGVVAEAATNLAVMYDGRWVEYGTVDQVVSDPLHPYTDGLLAAQPALDDPSARTRRLTTISRPAPMLDTVPVGWSEPGQEETPGIGSARYVRVGDEFVGLAPFSKASVTA